jgi:hypothetical protein
MTLKLAFELALPYLSDPFRACLIHLISRHSAHQYPVEGTKFHMVLIRYAPYAARIWYRVREHTVSIGACDGYVQNVAEMLRAWVQVPPIRLVRGTVLSLNNLFQLRL